MNGWLYSYRSWTVRTRPRKRYRYGRWRPARFTVVPFEGDQAASYGEDLRAAITAMREECDGVLVFTDLLGGTPFNQAMMIAQDVDNVEILTGTNLPMVIELLFLRGNATLAELGEQAVTVGQTGITAQTVASVAGAEEEDIFGDEDGI